MISPHPRLTRSGAGLNLPQHVQGAGGPQGFEDQNRPYHNVAVTLTGLYLLKYAMGRKFGTRYDETLDEIMGLLLTTPSTILGVSCLKWPRSLTLWVN